MRPVGWTLFLLSAAVCSGCSLIETKIDREASELASRVQQIDVHAAVDPSPATVHEVRPIESLPAPAPTAPTQGPNIQGAMPSGFDATPSTYPQSPGSFEQANLQPASYAQVDKKPPPRLVEPPGLPGHDAPSISKFPEDPEQKKKYLQRLFPPLPSAPQLRPLAAGPEGRPMTLGDLQRLAAMYSPAIKTAEAAVEAAKGQVKQSGVYPNPNIFFEQDTVGTGPGGYEGIGFNQTIKTANKLKLQQAAATMELLNARLALKRAYTDLAYQVRTNYFAVLVALEGVKINQALYQFTNDIYRVQVELVEGTLAAPYEPLQLRPLANLARFNLIQSQNQYLASWKQLAATLGLREMPPTELYGRVDMPLPVFEYNDVLARVLANHTDVLSASNSIQKARYLLEFARVTPIPDAIVNVLVQKDYTAAPNLLVHSLQFALPTPIFDQNLGNIKTARANLAQAMANVDNTRNTLTSNLADAFNRYETNRELVDISMDQIRDQLRAYRSLRQRRYEGEAAGVGFGDLVNAQQTLAGYISGYVVALGGLWTAVSDVANLLQTDDLFQVGPTKETMPVPELERFTPPPGVKPGAPAPPQPKAPGPGASLPVPQQQQAGLSATAPELQRPAAGDQDELLPPPAPTVRLAAPEAPIARPALANQNELPTGSNGTTGRAPP